MHKPNWKAVVSMLLLASLLSVLLPIGVFSSLSGVAQAETEETSKDENWRYSIGADGYATVLGYASETAASLKIPRMLGGAFVVRLAEHAFAGNEALEQITIPAAVADIPSTAFP